MPRYYFHLRDGRESLDDEGTELVDLPAARSEALKYSGELLRDGGGNGVWNGEPWQLWVTDQPSGKGNTLFRLNFSAAEVA